MSIVLTGQALIQSDVRQGWPDAVGNIRPLLQGDVVFTNFESMVLEHGASKEDLPPHDMGHYGPPEMLDALQDMGFNLIGTANNHAYDLLENGVMNVIRNLNERKLAYSGTGANVDKATEAGYLDTPKGRVALVSTATGVVRENGAATATKPGVNELRLDGDVPVVDPSRSMEENASLMLESMREASKAGNPLAEDADRILASIREARKNADLVISYHHNHLFDEDFGELIGGRSPNRYTPPNWIKDWSRRQIDEGADIVIIQGLPLMQGLEIYKGRPIFYDMGNFMFQLDVAWKHMFYEGVLRSVIAKVEFDGRELKSIEFSPIVLTNDVREDHARHLSGIPSPAKGEAAQSILKQLVELSSELGTVMAIEGDKAVVNLGQTCATR